MGGTCGSVHVQTFNNNLQKKHEPEGSEKQKNIQAVVEFWATMRQTHGFQNQAEGLKVQAEAVTEVARTREPGSSSKQQVEAHLESQENPKTRRRSDDEFTNQTNHSLDTIIARPTKRSKEFISDCAKPITTETTHGDTSTSGSRDATSLATNEAEKRVLTTHGFQTRTEKLQDFNSMTDTPLSGSGNKSSHTENAKTHQRQTSPTTPPRQAINNDIVHRNSTTYGVLVGTDTIALTPIQGTSTTSPTKKRDRHKHKHHSVSYTQSRLQNR